MRHAAVTEPVTYSCDNLKPDSPKWAEARAGSELFRLVQAADVTFSKTRLVSAGSKFDDKLRRCCYARWAAWLQHVVGAQRCSGLAVSLKKFQAPGST